MGVRRQSFVASKYGIISNAFGQQIGDGTIGWMGLGGNCSDSRIDLFISISGIGAWEQ